MITRAMAVSEINKVLVQADDFGVQKSMDLMTHTLNIAYYTYDTNAQFKTKIVNIEPIPLLV